MNNFSVGKFSDDLLKATSHPEYKTLIPKPSEKCSTEKKTIERHIIFKHEFDKKFTADIRRLLNTLFEFAEDIGLCRDMDAIRVVFIGYSFWKLNELSNGISLKTLPALKILPYQHVPAYVIVLSDKEQSPSDMMNITRLLFSKIFGENFFAGQLEKKPPFADIFRPPQFSHPSVHEKIAIGRIYFSDNPEFRAVWRAIGKKKQLAGEKGIKFGKGYFFRVIEHGEAEHIGFEAILDKVIGEFRKHTLRYFTLKNENPLKQVYEKNKVLYIILPHEVYKFRHLEKQPALLFTILAEKSCYLRSVFLQLRTLIGHGENDAFTLPSEDVGEPVNPSTRKDITDFTDDSTKSLKKKTSTVNLEPAKKNRGDAIDDARKSDLVFLNIIRDGLLNRKMANECLLTEAHLSKKQKKQRALLPFKIIRDFSEFESQRIDPETAGKIKNNYINSLSQRIYNVCTLKILELTENRMGVNRPDIADAIRINWNWVDFRYQNLSDFYEISHYFERLFMLSDPFSANVAKNMKLAKAGWSYFISSALLYVYYGLFVPEKESGSKKKGQFLKIIDAHIQKNSAEIKYFRFSALFMCVFQKVNFDMGKMIRIIVHRSPALTSAICGGLLSHKEPSPEYLEKISRSIINWLDLLEETQKQTAP